MKSSGIGNRRVLFLGLAALCVVATGSAYLVGRARAAGAPTTQPLTYSGTLTDTGGAPITGAKNLQVQIWDAATAGNIVCSTPSAMQTLIAGNFAVPLPATCVTAVHANPELWTEVLVDGSSAGRSKIGAVPYALEADTASGAAGALATRLGTIEAGNFGAHDTAGNAARICSGTSATWQVCPAAACGTTPMISMVVDMSACKFTAKPLVFPVIAGNGSHWTTTGGSAPYPSPNAGTEKTQFGIYINSPGATPATAAANGWRIDWIAIGS